MKIQKVSGYDELSEKAAGLLAQQIGQKADSVLGLATGSTPVGMYQKLIEMYRGGRVSFARVQTFNLDEYCGIPADHPESYRRFMMENLFSHIDIPAENIHLLDGNCADAGVESRKYEALIEGLGGIDLQVLGIGNNGHIGFNEPSDSFSRDTHEVTLAGETRGANARFFEGRLEDVPQKAITLGMRGIMCAKHILLLSSGEGKHKILQAALDGPITPRVPASILQLHPHVDVIYC